MRNIVSALKLLVVLFLMMPAVQAQETKKLWMDDLNIKAFSEGIPGILPKTNQGGDPMRMQGKTYSHGVGVASTSILSFLLEGKATAFSATVGVDDLGVKMLPHFFYVMGDGKILFESGEMKLGDQPKSFAVDLKGIQRMGMLVMVKDEGYTKVYANWADAQITMLGDAIPKSTPNSGEKYILTPAASKTPRINTAPVFGVTPGNPFLFTIVASGEKPMQFSVDRLPQGLTLDAKTGIISGKLMAKGNHVVLLSAKNQFGKSQKTLRIKVGDTISLTPPIGWNGWNSWARLIDREKVLASANAMVNMGLKDHGCNYVNIDDAWQGYRGGKYNAIQPNEKFPNFKELIDEIHGMGLKLGVYSTPWITSYAGYIGGSSNIENGAYPDSVKNNKRNYRYIGKYRFEKEDALQMADWGVDFLKYDWRLEVPSAERMSIALKNAGRDIIYSLSNSAPFRDVKDWVRVSNMYRTGPDIRDSWHGLYHCTFTLDKWGPYGGPGHWNDPDMMILGNVTTGSDMHPTRLTPDEQYSHISLFALLSAPLLIGCPIEQLDAFTLNLLTNDEVIEIDQDPLGKSARLISDEGGVQTWLKPMEDGSYAVGFFNTDDYGKNPQSFFRWGTEKPKNFNATFAKLGLKGKWRVQDVWRQKNMGVKETSFNTTIPHHGVMMYRLYPIK
jgi:alpha-galactosidase